MKVVWPTRAAFYYGWFPETTFGRYTPTLGFYSTDDPTVRAKHIEWMLYARIGVAIASWWGPKTHHEDTRLWAFLEQSRHTRLGWSVYYEKGQALEPQIQADLAYLQTYAAHPRWARVDGKPVIFVYDTVGDCDVPARWANAAPGWHVVLKVFQGWRDCPSQPASWHQYGPSTHYQEHLPWSAALSPGFWRGDQPEPGLDRNPARFQADLMAQVASDAHWQVITTFNEFGEGTAIEPTTEWGTIYLDMLHAARVA